MPDGEPPQLSLEALLAAKAVLGQPAAAPEGDAAADAGGEAAPPAMAETVAGEAAAKDKASNDEPAAAGPATEEEHESTAGAPGSHKCNLFDATVVAQAAEALLRGLASAVVHQTAGTLVKVDVPKAAQDIFKEMLPLLDKQSSAHRDQRAAAAAAAATAAAGGTEAPPLSQTPGTLKVMAEMLDAFAKSRRSFLSRLFTLDANDPRIDSTALELERHGVWSQGHREALARELIRRLDTAGVEHCREAFPTADKVARHRAECPFRSVSCDSQGCNEVLAARRLAQHQAECPHLVLPCRQGCGALLRRMDMERHCSTDCSMMTVRCPFTELGCCEPVTLGSVAAHCEGATRAHLDLVRLHMAEHRSSINEQATRHDVVQKQLNMVAANVETDLKNLLAQSKELAAKVTALERENRLLKAEAKTAKQHWEETLRLKEELGLLRDYVRKRLPT